VVLGFELRALFYFLNYVFGPFDHQVVFQLWVPYFFAWGWRWKWVFPPLLPLLQAFPLLVAVWVPPLLLWLTCLFTVPSVLLLLIIQGFFSLFSLGRGQSVQGAMLIWPRVVCGSTAYRLAHIVARIFPSRLGTGI
jgi:hypothetical protein